VEKVCNQGEGKKKTAIASEEGKVHISEKKKKVG